MLNNAIVRPTVYLNVVVGIKKKNITGKFGYEIAIVFGWVRLGQRLGYAYL